MASAVEICNLALSFLGDTGSIASIDPPESPAQAKMCAIYYPIAKSAMLEMHDWSFATKRQLLAKLSSEETAERRLRGAVRLHARHPRPPALEAGDAELVDG